MELNSYRALALTFGRLLFGAVLLMGTAAHVVWAQAPAEIEATLKQMLVATENRRLDAFVAQGDASFQADITPAMFNNFSAQVGPRLRQGYTASFLTQLRQQSYVVYVWKLEFKDGGDDILFSLAVKGGKVGGFSLQ
ncbi:MAG TPA: hypothetical protein VEJ00_07290 [Candidatus Acidoferrales bacterium]|nr:hypothetical protein [Candidatus Acidoferrales bacterium]